MADEKVYPVPADAAAHAHITDAQYKEMYQRSVDDPEGFWAEQAEKFVTWFKPWDEVLKWDFHKAKIRWFDDAELNVCLQLRGPASRDTRRSGGDPVGR